jgi:hypothetical protein
MMQNNRPAGVTRRRLLAGARYGGGWAGRRVGRDTAGASPGRRRAAVGAPAAPAHPLPAAARPNSMLFGRMAASARSC